ncbi:MAG: hypothetical protein RXQ00_02130 [Caldivirga sp.]
MRFLSIVTGTSSDGAAVSLIELEGCGKGPGLGYLSIVTIRIRMI